MKSLSLLLMALLVSGPALAATTVTVDGDQVQVQQADRDAGITNRRPTSITATEPLDDREFRIEDEGQFEAEVIDVDAERGQVVVRYLDTVERRLDARRDNVATLKTGDYVRVYMRGDGRGNEAWKLVKVD